MRMTRLFVAGLLTAALVPATGSAQRVRDFEDSWFWGVKGGVSAYSPTYGDSRDCRDLWRRVAHHAHARRAVRVRRPGKHRSDVCSVRSDCRRQRTPGRSREAAPRRICGACVPEEIRSASVLTPASVSRSTSSATQIRFSSTGETSCRRCSLRAHRRRKSQAALLGMGGVQAQVRRAAVFGQASFMPANKKFLLDDAHEILRVRSALQLGGAREGIK